MDRITQKDLDQVVRIINKETGSPEASYTKDKDGKYHANPNNYHLDSAYGGYGLVRMCNEGGGVTSIISGFHPKRDLYNRMVAFLDGLRAGKEA